MPSKKISSSQVVAISAICISLMTLIVLLYQTQLMREHSRLSVQPSLSVNRKIENAVTIRESSYAQDTMVKVSVRILNKGLGPAVIESVRIKYGNSEMTQDEFYSNYLLPVAHFGLLDTHTRFSQGQLLMASEEATLLSFSYPASKKEDVVGTFGHDPSKNLPFTVIVQYASIYGERWEKRSDSEGYPKLIQ